MNIKQPPLRTHTHCQVAQKSQHTDLNLSKSMVARTHELTEEIKHENTTSCIVHLADGVNFKGVAFNKRCCGLIGWCFDSPNDTIHITVMHHII